MGASERDHPIIVIEGPTPMADREALKALILRKDELEKQILDASEAVSAENMGGASGALVDSEGYPVADIDIHTTRIMRNKLASLNFDHQALMRQIEAGLTGGAGLPATHERPLPPITRAPPSAASNAAASSATAAAAAAATGATPIIAAPSTGPSPMEVVDIGDADADLEAFALIDEVFADGPAASAGVVVNDALLQFGSLNASNHDGLRALARLTQRSVGDSIPLLVLRGGTQRVRLSLQPRRWSGQGLLGCHLRPL